MKNDGRLKEWIRKRIDGRESGESRKNLGGK
jgi:hypothetical protein